MDQLLLSLKHRLKIFSNGDVVLDDIFPPPDEQRRLPSGRLFGRIKRDYELWGMSRPTYYDKGIATLGMPQTVKVLEPKFMHINQSWALFWADLFSLEHYKMLYAYLNDNQIDFINNALLGATVGWRAVTNGTGHDDGYHEYWTGMNSGSEDMRQETINFGGNYVELFSNQIERRGGKDVYKVRTLDANKPAPSALEVNQFNTPWLVAYATISRRNKIFNAQGKWTGEWVENISTPWPQLPTGVPICFMGDGEYNYIVAERIEIQEDNAIIQLPYFNYP